MLVFLLALVALQQFHMITLTRRDWFAPLFLTNYFPGSWYTRHFWTLAVEEHFYLMWPLCILPAGWRRSLWIGVGIMVAVGIWRPWALAHLGISQASPDYDLVHGAWLSHTDMRIDYILAGCVLALVLRFYPGTMRLVHKIGSVLGLLGVVVTLELLDRLLRHTPLDGRTFEAIAIALVVVCSSLTKTWFSTYVLGNRVMLFLGKISYSLYLWQQLVFADWSSATLRSPLMLPLKFLVTIVISYVSYKLVEEPMILAGRKVLQKHRKVRESAEPAEPESLPIPQEPLAANATAS